MKKLVSIFILSLVIFSCSSNQNIGIENSDISGKWNWTNTDGGMGFHIHKTLESAEKSMQLILTKDYKYAIIENGAEIATGDYELLLKKSIHSGELERFLQLTEKEQYNEMVVSGIIRKSSNLVLEISHNNHDGIGSKFKKLD